MSDRVTVADITWVDFNASVSGDGSELDPFITLQEAVDSVASSSTVRLYTGYTSEAPRLTKAMRLEAVSDSGEPVGSKTYQFQVESEEEYEARTDGPADTIWQPQYDRCASPH